MKLLDKLRGLVRRPRVSPDGWAYLAVARGEPVARPYAYRWLLPTLLGIDARNYVLTTYASLAAVPALAWLYFGAMGLDGLRRGFAVALLCALPGLLRVSIRLPVLTDAPGFALALATAWAARAGHLWAAVPLALVAGAVREQAPVFAALWAWSPLPLLGVVAAGWWRPYLDPTAERPAENVLGGYRIPPPEPLPPWLAHPFREAWKKRRELGLDGSLYVRPWGAALLGLALPSWQLGATLAVAYGQLLAAQDTIRLYQWAGPVLVAHAAGVIPPDGFALLALVWTLVHREDRV